ncbi:zinc-ribbon domain-containing protein [Celeribacter halophilus]|uniref:zinc-ribbon domain-containing protein n=1 Tax=Celeribacter halophilus TaxID=576117 RepID=UPI003A8EC52D
MRLICPNCGAQYEVDSRVIPDTGRDVQCSNCGHTWFQQPAHMDKELAEELGYEIPDEDASLTDTSTEPAEVQPAAEEIHEDVPAAVQAPEPAIEPELDPVPEPEIVPEPVDVPEPVFEPEPEFEAEQDAISVPEAEPEYEIEDSEDLPPPAQDTAPQSSVALKDSVRDILRAEVEFDHAMRQTEGETIETQPDLGLEEPAQDSAKKSLRERMARLRGLDPADPGLVAGGVAAATGKRRDLLPDIEEINSTLSAASERDDDGTVPDEDTRRERAERSGFRTVFLTLVLIAVFLVALYILSPLIAAKVPALAGVMETYVHMANSFRGWLDQTLSAASARLNALLGQLSS